MSEAERAEALAATRDALHRACYALLSLEWAVGHSSQTPISVGAILFHETLDLVRGNW